jgi:1,4-alpha-glucan branching enzyme
MAINLSEVGASVTQGAGGAWTARFGVYLPGITYNKGYRVKVRVIHEDDQFVRGIEPRDFWLNWENGSALDRWEATVPLVPVAGTHFGQTGRYLYRYQLFRGDREVTFWFSDPFARASGIGTLSAFTAAAGVPPFPWTDAGFRTPEVDDLVVYELHVGEFNQTFQGVVDQLDYLWELGVNVLELMPVTNVKEETEWGYTPLGFFAPDERYGGIDGMKRLVDACHGRGIAVVLDAVYAHAHPEFPFNLVYDTSGEPNPMMGHFEGEFFSRPGMDYRTAFTRDYFLAVNRYWMEEYHVDGFRYDYVPGMYDGPTGRGYADLVFQTYQASKAHPRFQAAGGRSRIIQCAEHLPDPKGVLSQTYSNTAWQNGLLDKARDMARWGYVNESYAHLLDPEFLGYPSAYTNPATGDTLPVAPFQYVESHDHGRFVNEFGRLALTDLLGERYGDRSRFYKTQPHAIALYTAKGVPMLWQGQEFAENWGVPGGGLGRNLFGRPVHWEYFYDPAGKALVRLYRILGTLRRTLRSLKSRGHFYYYFDRDHLARGVIAYRREAPAAPPAGPEVVIVLLNFWDTDAEVWVQFPRAGTWVEQIDAAGGSSATVTVGTDGQWVKVTVKSNYGAVYLHS